MSREIQEIIEVPKANDMPHNRWEAYMRLEAINRGFCGRFGIGTLDGMSRITVYSNQS
jgi:hypothetical protein